MRTSKPLILIVEDESSIRSTITEILTLQGFNVLEADNAHDGLRIAVQRQPDVVVSDIHMPKDDGYVLLDRLRKNISTIDIPVLLLTADVSEAAMVRGFESGTNDFLIKPFSARELVLRLRALIAARHRVEVRLTTRVLDVPLVSDDDVFISQLRKEVESLLAQGRLNDLSINAIASTLGVSVATLHRRVRRILGTSIGQWLLEYRLERARQMVAANAGPMHQIARATGFSGPAYFSFAFRRRFGVTPREYRLSERERMWGCHREQGFEDAALASMGS